MENLPLLGQEEKEPSTPSRSFYFLANFFFFFLIVQPTLIFEHLFSNTRNSPFPAHEEVLPLGHFVKTTLDLLLGHLLQV